MQNMENKKKNIGEKKNKKQDVFFQNKKFTTMDAKNKKENINEQQFTLVNFSERKVKSEDNINRLMDLELPISVELGRKRLLVKEILELEPGVVIELKKFSGEPVDIYVDNKKFAEGEVVKIEQNFGVRITALVGPDDRLPRLDKHK